jgi:hypothetical protein
MDGLENGRGDRVTDEQRQRIAREIALFADVPDMADYEITVKDYAIVRGISENAARRQLDTQVREGRLTSRLVWDVRVKRNVTGYRKVAQRVEALPELEY